jgi:hypothetical protein
MVGREATQRLIDFGSNPLKNLTMRRYLRDEVPASDGSPRDGARHSEAEGLTVSGGRLDTLPTSMDALKHLPVETSAELAAFRVLSSGVGKGLRQLEISRSD